MLLLITSFIAGVLTVLAPCILSLLPVIIGGAVQGKRPRNPYVITFSLAGSVVIFTLLLKFSTAFIDIPQGVWGAVSGLIIVLFGLASLFPNLWDVVNFRLGLSTKSESLLALEAAKSGWKGDALLGMALGPVFSSCSPTYFVILASVLPQSFIRGLTYLFAYALGLSGILLLISLLGRRFVSRVQWAANPNGWFKRGLGILFIVVGVFIMTGLDKKVQTFLVERDYYAISSIEKSLLSKLENTGNASQATLSDTSPTMPITARQLPRYREIVSPSGYVNTEPFALGEIVGKKVILLDFMTYSCINCIRTFPYVNAWYEKYRDQGLEIVGIHTPEFAFEHKIENVRKAMDTFGIRFPVVLDNDYGTWRAYGNNYWPRKYLIDIDGYIVYDHIGEGEYDVTEKKIQELLAQKMVREKQKAGIVPAGLVSPTGTEKVETISPETYFGALRNNLLANGIAQVLGEQKLVAPKQFKLNQLYLDGTWDFGAEHAKNTAVPARIIFRYGAHNVFLVASSAAPVRIKVLRNGKPVSADAAGDDIHFINGESYLTVNEERLYSIIDDESSIAEYVLELYVETPGLEAYTFTFG